MYFFIILALSPFMFKDLGQLSNLILFFTLKLTQKPYFQLHLSALRLNSTKKLSSLYVEFYLF